MRGIPVRLCAPRSLCEKMVPEILEATLFPLDEADGSIAFREENFREALQGTRSAAFGMGAGNTEETGKAVQYLLQRYEGTLILDADGLNALAAAECAGLREAKGRVILTPHPGEFSRLSGMDVREVLSKPVQAAEAYARETGAVVLLKGPATVVTDGSRTRIIDAGCAGMATAGSGDVLSGILAATAAVAEPLEAASAAAYVNGKAGELAQSRMGSVAMTAGDTAGCVAEVVHELEFYERKKL